MGIEVNCGAFSGSFPGFVAQLGYKLYPTESSENADQRPKYRSAVERKP